MPLSQRSRLQATTPWLSRSVSGSASTKGMPFPVRHFRPPRCPDRSDGNTKAMRVKYNGAATSGGVVRSALAVLVALLLLAGCGDGGNGAGGPGGGWGGPGGGRPATLVATQPAVVRPIADLVEAIGTAQANESVTITAKGHRRDPPSAFRGRRFRRRRRRAGRTDQRGANGAPRRSRGQCPGHASAARPPARSSRTRQRARL